MNLKIILKSRLILNILGSFLLKCSSMLISMIMVPLYISYFLDEKITGFWFLIISILNIGLIFDFGIGNGIRNLIIENLQKKRMKKIQNILGSSYILLFIFIIFTWTVFYIIFNNMNWLSFFNITEKFYTENHIDEVLLILYLGVGIQIILRMIISVLYALDKIVFANFIPLLINLFMILWLKICIFLEISILLKLKFILISYLVITNLTLLLMSLYIYKYKYKYIAPVINKYSKCYFIKITKIASLFFLIQLNLMLMNNTNEYLINYFFNSNSVVDFQIYNRIFIIFISFYTILTIPIWTKITNYHIEKKNKEILKILKILVLLSLVLGIIIFISFPLLKEIINLWLGLNTIKIETNILYIFTLFTICQFLINSFSAILNGINEIKIQAILGILFSILKFPVLAILDIYYKKWEIIMIANILVMIPNILIQYKIIRRNIK